MNYHRVLSVAMYSSALLASTTLGACFSETCGDNLRVGEETCDDGNILGGDGCSASCQIEACGNGVTDEGEECDDGNLTSLDGCDENCIQEVCGDGIVNNNHQEACDDGNNTAGDGCESDCSLSPLLVNLSPRDIAVEDIDEDGNVDIVAAVIDTSGDNTKSTVHIFYGNGNGTFLPPDVILLNELSTNPGTVTAASLSAIAVADVVSALGDPNAKDILLARFGGSSDLLVLEPQTTTAETKPSFVVSRILSTGDTPSDLVVADFNRDGSQDVVVSNAASNDIALLTDIGGSGAPVFFPVGNKPDAVVAADLNQDGALDVVIGNTSSSTVDILLGKNEPGVIEPQQLFTALKPVELNGEPVSVALGDINHDELVDIVTSNRIGPTLDLVVQHTGSLDFSFTTDQSLLFPNKKSLDLGIVDVDGDGQDDILCTLNNDTNDNGQIAVLLQNNGVFSVDTTEIPLVSVGLNPISVVVKDINNDGFFDLVVANFGSNDITVRLGDGTGNFH